MEAAATVSGSGFQEQGSDSRIMTDSLRDFVNVHSGYLLSDVGYGVDETDICGEEGVAGILDQLSCLRTRGNDRWELGPIEFSVGSCELVC